MGERRHCTDFFCLLFFLGCCAGVVGITAWGASTGDTNALFYDSDYLGNRCGVGDFSTRKKAFYPRLGQDLASQPTIVASGAWYNLNLYALCIESCQAAFNIADPQLIRDYGFDPTSATTIGVGPARLSLQTRPVVMRPSVALARR